MEPQMLVELDADQVLEILDENATGETVSDLRRDIYWKVQDDEMQLWVVLSDRQDAYGGPEEGGWWYGVKCYHDARAYPLPITGPKSNPAHIKRWSEVARRWLISRPENKSYGQSGSFGGWRDVTATRELIPYPQTAAEHADEVARTVERPYYC